MSKRLVHGPMMGAPYQAMHDERIRAHEKFKNTSGSMEDTAWDSPKWLPVVMEEVGEIARAICEYNLGNVEREELKAKLTEEATQSAAMLAAWLDALSEVEYR
jgi:NTP pyrophosphatase (non-canonical NTP hydrolase)